MVPPPKEWTKTNLISERQGVNKKEPFVWSQVKKARTFFNENYVVLKHKIVKLFCYGDQDNAVFLGLDYIVGLSSQYGQFHAIQDLFQEYGKCLAFLSKYNLNHQL